MSAWCDSTQARETGKPYPSDIRAHTVIASKATILHFEKWKYELAISPNYLKC